LVHEHKNTLTTRAGRLHDGIAAYYNDVILPRGTIAALLKAFNRNGD
jgi:hypothetical protein